ncbi:efflux RND transporter permease subunit [Parerythrobacter jejuensis]|uniref:AcrB/AcrD/AcrF family protein n=1 Tax=Parerythrobacter jejuensis TaxID=795812 RepID=A0A845ANV4_9SPHN|nr:efflux RND transporter permease subunit [Parerythrobacter jejuensis]MXP30853.1 AcrB/AcrD/AcrF family protein [Parerythrobacter jejuensis]MXP33613.1 AcrB/AcrD/AcrF family protein [Parerythrobacter jejuensis]
MNFRNISAWSIRNPVIPLVFFTALLFAGMLSFARMDVVNNPDIEFPGVNITIAQPGAAPTEIENQITQRVESAVRSLNGVRNISSTAREGSSNTFVEFEIGTDVNDAVAEVKNAVDSTRGNLPDGILEPRINKVEIAGGFLAIYAVEADDMTIEQLSWFIDDAVAKRLLSIEGMAEVNRFAGVDREIEVILDPSKMQALGVTASQINNVLRLDNIDAGGGVAEVGGTRQSVRVLGNNDSAYELSQRQIRLGGGRTIKLADVATVRDGFSERTSISKVRDKEVVNFAMSRAKGASDVTVFDKALEDIAKIEAENPGVRFIPLFNTVKYTEDQYESSIAAMIEGAILAVVVVFFFLRDWRATVISAVAIPLSAIPTFWFMDLLGFNLNQMSLLALGLVAGVLVDDAIVEIENIVRHMRMGKSAYQASIDAADEIGLAVVATSMCIVAVFLPVGLMPGVTGQFFQNFGLTIVAAVLMSLAVARMITPMMAAYFLQSKGEAAHGEGKWMDRYMSVLRWSLDRGKMYARREGIEHPPRNRFLYALAAILLLLVMMLVPGAVVLTLWGMVSEMNLPDNAALAVGADPLAGIGFLLSRVVALLQLALVIGLGFVAAVLTLLGLGLLSRLFGQKISDRWRYLEARFYDHRVWMLTIGFFSFLVTILLFMSTPFQFQPETDDDNSRIEIEMVPGTTLQTTERVADDVAALLYQQQEVDRALVRVREGQATIYITLAEDRQQKSFEFERSLAPELSKFADARVRFQSQGGPGGPGSGRDLTIMLAGSDPILLKSTAANLVEEMKGLDMVTAPRINADIPRPEIVIRPRADIAAELGVTTIALSQTIRIATLGEIEQNAAKFSLSDRQIPIRVKLPLESRRDLETIAQLPVQTANGGSVPLERVAEISFGSGPTSIQRYNQNRRVFIGADLATGVLRGDAMEQINALPTLADLPAGVIRDAVGEDELQVELLTNFQTALIAGILLVFATLVLLYKRLMSPLVNMASLALAPLGGIFLVWIVGQPLSMPVLIGILLLLGIVSKNSILLIDFAIEEMETGRRKLEAIVDAGHKRAQPIVMTTVAMTAGMVPTALSISGDGAWRAPMGTVVIGGLILSTLLTLLIVPPGFSLADGLERRMGPWMRQKFLTYRPGDADGDKAPDDAGPEATPAE